MRSVPREGKPPSCQKQDKVGAMKTAKELHLKSNERMIH